MTREQLILAGEILKTHGISGKLFIRFDLPVDVESLTFLFPVINGLPVPFRVLETEPAGDNTRYVTLEGIDNREKAMPLTGTQVFMDKSNTRPSSDDLNRLAGYLFRDVTSGKEGKILNWINVPGNPLVEVISENHHYYLPGHTDFIVKTDHIHHHVTLRLPEGLFSKS
ncbi:MAG: hypothetical protein GXO83_13005 [Chlorobi bacterium]|nr:hypothetical protein [Chlorobiota bacterium]